MLLHILFLGCLLLETYGVRGEHSDIEYNRLRVIPEKHSRYYEANNLRPSVEYRGRDDHDNHSGGFRPYQTIRRHPNSVEEAQDQRGKVYEPREDPRQFYQSRSYLRSSLERKDGASRQMSGVYPDMVERLFGQRDRKSNNYERSSRYKEWNYVSDYDEDICVKCPAERTLVARPGTDKVLLQAPSLKSCTGDKPPGGVNFFRLYGPNFGSLISAGSHVLVGKIMYKGRSLKECRFHVHVITQLCQVPPYLTSKCRSTHCNFTCTNSKQDLVGSSSLVCGRDLQWMGEIPVCRVRTWCLPPPLPANGQLSCQSAPTTDGQGVVEGSRCRAHCQPGWRVIPRGAAVCRRGMWTHALSCKKIHRNRRQESGHL